MFTASNDQKVMNLRIFRYLIKSTDKSKKSLDDELNQPTSFPTAHSNKRSPKNPIWPKTQ